MRADSAVRLRPRANAGTRLVQALLTLAEGRAHLLSHTTRDWASATFTGSRHRVELAFVADAAVAAGERFIAQLPEHEFTIPGQIVADAAVVSTDHRLLPQPALTVVCEVLLLAED